MFVANSKATKLLKKKYIKLCVWLFDQFLITTKALILKLSISSYIKLISILKIWGIFKTKPILQFLNLTLRVRLFVYDN